MSKLEWKIVKPSVKAAIGSKFNYSIVRDRNQRKYFARIHSKRKKLKFTTLMKFASGKTSKGKHMAMRWCQNHENTINE